MFNQNRIYRVFQLLNILRKKPAKTPRMLSGLLDISERSVYRYIDLITQLGFEVKKEEAGRFYIENNDENQIPFTPQEVDYITKMVQSVGKNSAIAQSVLQKVGQNTEHEVAARNIYQAHLGHIINQLSVAIKEKKQVMLLKYVSARSETETDRLVEPVQFTDNYEAISAFEVRTGQNKYFNIERISEVAIMETDIQFEAKHQFFKPDIFGFQGREMNKEVEFEMSLRASILLKEEYPMSRKNIKPLPDGKRFIFKSKVQAYEGPARFVKGFKDEITVHGDDDFRLYLEMK
jgi:predicted DNA-binding transcriptional regulator YafY